MWTLARSVSTSARNQRQALLVHSSSLPLSSPHLRDDAPCRARVTPGVCDDPDYFYDYVDGLYAGMGWAGPGARQTLAAVQARGLGYAISSEEELATVQVGVWMGRHVIGWSLIW